MNMLHRHNSNGRSATMVLSLCFCLTAVASAATTGLPLSSTNILAPASTPAKTIFGLSMFVLAVTTLIFVVVCGLLVYSVLRFRGRDADIGREPPQVYG